MKKFKGKIYWYSGDFRNGLEGGEISAVVTRAILDKDVITIDHEANSDLDSALIRLKTKDGLNYAGSMKYRGSSESDAMVNYKYYSNSSEILLLGKWVEDQELYTSIIELSEIEAFNE